MTDPEAHEALVIARRTQRAAWVRWTLMALFVAFLFWRVQLNSAHNSDLIRSQRATQQEGRAQFCKLFQRSHDQAVRQRDDTVKFLRHPPAGLDSPGFVKVVRSSLPHLQSEVRATKVPAVCGPFEK